MANFIQLCLNFSLVGDIEFEIHMHMYILKLAKILLGETAIVAICSSYKYNFQWHA